MTGKYTITCKISECGIKYKWIVEDSRGVKSEKSDSELERLFQNYRKNSAVRLLSAT